MGMTGKHKAKMLLEEDGLSAWLRDLADALEAGELPSETGPVSLEGMKGLKISMKRSWGGKVEAKLQVKFPKPVLAFMAPPEAGEGEAQGALPKYKSVKKHMKQTFKTIGQALAAGQVPPLLEARSFIADARLMASYPGKGEEFYPAFVEKTEAFEQALAASDVEAMKTFYQELAGLKRECHSRYV